MVWGLNVKGLLNLTVLRHGALEAAGLCDSVMLSLSKIISQQFNIIYILKAL